MGIRSRKRGNSLGMLILNLVLICAMIVNGTYAWIHIGQSVGGALLYINEENEVVLEKYEKDAEGNIVVDEDGNPIPMEDVGFALFTESGEQIGDVRYTDEEGKIYATVPVGNFYFQEVYYPNGYGPDTDEDGEYIYKYEFTIGDTASEDTQDGEGTTDSGDAQDGEDTTDSVDAQDGEDTTDSVDAQDGEDTTDSVDAQDGEDTTVITDTQDEESSEEKDITYIIVYNKPLETSLEIEKTVVNFDGTELSQEQLEQEFEFTITLGNENAYSYYILNADGTAAEPADKLEDNTEEDTQDSEEDTQDSEEDTQDSEEETMTLSADLIEELDEGAYSTNLEDVLTRSYSSVAEVEYTGTISDGDKIYLKHGQVAIIDDIPIETYYLVTETKQANYYIETETVSGNITFGANKVLFINIFDAQFGSIIVSKEVEGEGFDPDQEFLFTATVNGEEFQFTLKDGESHLFENLPVGSTYKVEEYDYIEENFYAYPLSYEGTLLDTVQLELPFINIYNPGDVFGDLIIYKEVIEDETEEPTESEDLEEVEDLVFSFKVEFANTENPDEPRVETFDLKDGEFRVFKNIFAGTSFTVTETDTQGYLPDYNEIKGYVVGKKYDDSLELDDQDLQIITFYNRKPAEESMKELQVTKWVTGEGIPDSDNDKEFEFTLSVNGIEEDFTLKDKETKSFEVPENSQYIVTEKVYIDEGYSQEIIGGIGTIYQDVTKVTVINDYFKGDVDIEGEKTWDSSFEAEEFIPESITVNLMLCNENGEDTIVESKVVVAVDGVWKYAFQAPKANSEGIPFEYYVEEVKVKNFVADYPEGTYDIYNNYALETEVNIPSVEKQIKGIGSTNEKFTFVLKAIDDAPMPSGVAGDKTVEMITGAGSDDFGSIVFTEAEVYKYTITEVNDGLEDWIYDETTYNFEVEVKLVEGVLTATATLDNGEAVAEKAIFVNEYIGEDKDDTDSDDGDDDDLGASHFYVEGTKTWDHGLNSSEHQPTKLVVYVLGNGEVYQAVETSSAKNWSYKFIVPFRDEEGNDIKYTIGEEPVDGYNGVAIGYNLYNTFDLSSLVEPDSPQTSDYSQIWIWVWGLVASTITFAYVNRRKRVLIHGRRW